MKQHFSFGMTEKFIKINCQMMTEANGCLDIYVKHMMISRNL